jgi:uncharacterized membrane protein
MKTSHLKSIDSKTLRQLTPAIREAWRTDSLKVFLALLIKDSLKQGINYHVVIASGVVLTLEWLADYLKKNHEATASIEVSSELLQSLMRDSITLSLEIS